VANKACVVLLSAWLLLPATIFAQKKDSSGKVTVNIVKMESLIFNKTDSGEFNRLIGGVVLQQGTDTLYCDSAYQNTTTKNFEAFSNVKIAQQNGTQGKSDYLKYTSAQKLAYMRGNVSLTDGKNNLKTEELTYDLGTKIGTYYNGGTLYNDSTTVTSKTGVYNANAKESHFTGNVIINDPEYKIRSEDLVYNTESKITRFYAHSIVTRDSGKSILETTNGTYDGKRGIAHFVGHSSIWNDEDYIEGDSLDYNKAVGHGIANGHVICIDTIHHSRLFCGHAEYFHKKRVIWASIKPVLEQVNNKDTFYMRADTFYTAPMVKAKPAVVKPRIRLTDNDSMGKPNAIIKDSLGHIRSLPVAMADTQNMKSIHDTVIPQPKAVVGPMPDYIGDSIYALRKATQDIPKQTLNNSHDSSVSLKKTNQENIKDTANAKQGLKKPGAKTIADSVVKNAKRVNEINWIVPSGPKFRMLDTLNIITGDTVATPKPDAKNKKNKKSLAVKHLAVPDTSLADTTAPMYFVGWNHVLLFSDSMQGKCDSICYTRSDSLIRMINDPIDWAHNSQVTGDTILLQLDSNELRSMYVPNNALVVSQSGPPKAQLYNQVQGKTLTAYLNHSAITHMIVVPDAECIYYSQDEHNAYMGMDQTKSVRMIIYFNDQKISNIKFDQDDKIKVTPMEQVDIPNARLSRFKWLPELRPKTKEELFK
jgi:lipopolysaccharide export system protein LptA